MAQPSRRRQSDLSNLLTTLHGIIKDSEGTPIVNSDFGCHLRGIIPKLLEAISDPLNGVRRAFASKDARGLRLAERIHH